MLRDSRSLRRKKPPAREGEATWALKDDKSLGIIASSLDDDYIHYIDGFDTSYGAWVELEKVFRVKAKSSKISLLIQLFGLQMKKIDSLAAHLNHMKSLTNQVIGIKANVEEDICIALLLKSLPLVEYGHIITTLTNLPKPKLVGVISSLLDEEKKIK